MPDGEPAAAADASAAVLGRMEATLRDVQRTLAIQFQRIASMQAELDKLALTIRDHLADPPLEVVRTRRPRELGTLARLS